MLICEPGDTVVVPFPFVDSSASKRRPAVIVSARNFNVQNGHSILAMITTAAHSFWPSDYRLDDLAAAGLSHSSVVRMKVFTLPNGLLIRRLGTLSQGDKRGLDMALTGAMAR